MSLAGWARCGLSPSMSYNLLFCLGFLWSESAHPVNLQGSNLWNLRLLGGTLLEQAIVQLQRLS